MGYPHMTAPPSLLVLPEMIQKFKTEASYAELKDRHDELQHQFKLQQLQDRKAFADQKEAILTQFEKQRAEMAPRLDGPLWRTVEQILSQKKDLEMELLRRTFEERERTLQKRRDDEERQYKQDLVTVVTALMSAVHAPSSGHQPPLLELQPCRMDLDSPQGAATSGQATSHAEAALTDPGGSEIPSRSQAIAPMPAMHATAEVESAFQGSVSAEPRARSPHTVVEHNQNPVTEASRHERSSPEAPVPGEPATTHETPGSKATVSVEDREQLAVAAQPLVRRGPFHKRKATEKPTDGSPASSQGRAKRPRTGNNASQADSMALDKSPPARVDSHRKANRTILFEVLYKTYKGKEENGIMKDGREIDPKTGKPVYRHIIVPCHHGSGKFYIVKCDKHGVHFGEHPLRGAGKHLASAQHSFMSKARSTAIDTLGYQVLGCTKELAERNNADFLKAVGDGYKPLNVNNLNQAARAKLGFRPLGPPGSQKAAAQRPEHRGASQAVTRPFAGITDPIRCEFYVACGRGGDVRCPVLVLPWAESADMAPAGLQGTLADIGFFGQQPDDGEQSEIPKLPKCFVYKRVGGHIKGIKGWASDYEDGGPLVNKREFPVLCVDNSDYRQWSIGWIKARNLAYLDFDDPSNSVNVPFFQEAQSYYSKHILRHRNNGGADPRTSSGSEGLGGSTLRQGSAGRFVDSATRVAAEDVVMEEAEAAPQKDGSDRDSDRDSVGKSATDSDDDAGRADAESRRTSISNRGESPGGPQPLDGTVGKHTPASTAAAPMSPSSHARRIAAQALGLQTPPLTAFTPINASPANATSRAQAGISRSVSASASSTTPGPPSGTGSVSSTTTDSGRVVEMRAGGVNSQQTSQGSTNLSVSLPERPADAIPPQHGSASQSQGTTTKPILPSLQNILKDASGLLSQPPTPAAAERLAPFPAMGIFPPPPASSHTINTGQPEPPREGRAVSVPVQQSNPMEPEKPRAGSASAAPLSPPLESARQGPAPEPMLPPQGQRQQPPQPIQLPPPSTARPDVVPLNASNPLSTPTASVLNTRVSSPALMPQPPDGPFSPALGLSKPNTPTALFPTGNLQPGGGGGFLPTMDVFDIAGCSQGGKEVFAASSPGEFLRLVDDHQSGVFRTADDAPAAVSIEPAKIKLVERSPAQGGAVCIVRIAYAHGDGGDDGTTMLVFEKARSTASGMQNGMVHARRFCRRLQVWNPQILCPAPGAGRL